MRPALAAAPDVATHPVKAPRIAFMHTWQATQTEGWWRYAFDHAGVPYKYISTQTAAADADLRSKYDVIIFAPVGYSTTQSILNGTPTIWKCDAMAEDGSDAEPRAAGLDRGYSSGAWA